MFFKGEVNYLYIDIDMVSLRDVMLNKKSNIQNNMSCMHKTSLKRCKPEIAAYFCLGEEMGQDFHCKPFYAV